MCARSERTVLRSLLSVIRRAFLCPSSRSTNRRSGLPHAFHLDAALLRFNRRDSISWRDILGGGALALGDAGSGKTSGPLTGITRAAHRAGATVVHTCVKPGDAAYWSALALEEGREPVVFRFGEHLFNPLAWEQARRAGGNTTGGEDSGRLVETLTQMAILPLRRMKTAGAGGGGGSGGGGDAFWEADAMRFLRHLITLFVLSGIPVSFELLAESLLNLPECAEDIHDPEWQARCPAYAVLLAAAEAVDGGGDPDASRDLDRAAAFLLRTVATIPDKTRASTVATVVSAISPYLGGVVGSTINPRSDDSSRALFQPSIVVERPCAVILDLPLQVWGESGAIVQRMLISAIQKEVLRRDLPAGETWSGPRAGVAGDSGAGGTSGAGGGGGGGHPVVIVMDECQEFLDAQEDAAFMRTARDRRGCALLATQNTGNLVNACANSRDARAAAETILALPSVKLFGATSDPETLAYMSKVFAETPQPRYSVNTGGDSAGSADGKGQGKRGRSPSGTVSTELRADVPAHEFARLKRGGPPSGFRVEMFCAVTGRIWHASRRPSLMVVIPQRPPKPKAPSSRHGSPKSSRGPRN